VPEPSLNAPPEILTIFPGKSHMARIIHVRVVNTCGDESRSLHRAQASDTSPPANSLMLTIRGMHPYLDALCPILILVGRAARWQSRTACARCPEYLGVYRREWTSDWVPSAGLG